MEKDNRKNVAFKRLAITRTNNILKHLKLLGNLSNTNNYSFSESEVRTILSAIEKEMKSTKMKFVLSLERKNSFKL